MKKSIFLSSLLLLVVAVAFSQETPLNQYVGTYNFPAGNDIPYVEVSLQDSILIAVSPNGMSTLQRVQADTFAIVEYQGIAIFTRSEDGQIKGLKVMVMGLDMEGERQIPAKIDELYGRHLSPFKF